MKTICPKCGKEYEVMSSLLGKSTECEGCGKKFIIQSVKKCPFCAEIIKSAAKVCKHCKSELAEDDADSSPSSKDKKGKRTFSFTPFDIKCENCNTYIEVNSRNLKNGKVKCPHCLKAIYVEPEDVDANREIVQVKGAELQPFNRPNVNNNHGIDKVIYYPLPERSPKLYTPGQVAWATLVGSVLGGAILMLLNANRLKRDADFSKIIVITSIGFVVLLIGVTVFSQNAMPSAYIICAIQASIMFWFSTSTQGQLIEEHKKRGGELASSWGATAAGLAGTVVAFIMALIVCCIIAASVES